MDNLFDMPMHGSVGDIGFTYYGTLPDKAIFIYSNGALDRNIEKHLYLSALEASLNGYDVIYINVYRSARYIEKGTLDGGGRLYPVIPFSIENLYDGIVYKVLKSRGGIIVPDIKEKANFAGIGLSLAIIVANDSFQLVNQAPYIQYALDMGKEIAILKCGLSNKGLQSLASDGCCVIDSFSDFLINPIAIGYESKSGKYGKDGFCFDIISLDGR